MLPPKTTVLGEESDGVTVEQHHHDQWSAEESSMAANSSWLVNMPTGLAWQPEKSHSDKDVVRSQHSHKLHKEMELTEESIRQNRLDDSRTGTCMCVYVCACMCVYVGVHEHVQDAPL